MKSIKVWLGALAAFLFMGVVSATPTGEFAYDKAHVEAVLAPVSEWDNGTDVSEVLPTGAVMNVSKAGGGIPPFLWGFAPSTCGACGGGLLGGCIYATIGGVVGGLAGVAGAYFLNNQDQESAKKAAIGCVVGTATGVGLTFLYFLITVGSLVII